MSSQDLPVVWRDLPESAEEYEAQRRRVYTLRVPDRFPLAIVRPRDVSQVVSAVRLAIEKNVRVAIRSGGHSWACWSVRQGSVLIDFVDFKHLNYDAANNILEASPGTIGTELVKYLQPKGRFFPGGHCATVALGGFLLQGGMGLNARTLPNLHCDAEPVVHTANNPDKGYFIAVLVVARADTEAEARSHLQILADTRPPNALQVMEFQPSDQTEDYAESLRLMPENHRWVVDNVYLDNEIDFAETVKEAVTSLPKGGIAFWEPMNPVSREPLKDMALSLHTDHYFAIYAAYKDPAEDEWHDTWVKRSMDGLRKHQHGSYLGDKDFQLHDTKYWSGEAGKKLMSIRSKWDPEGRICGYLDQGDKSGANDLSNQLR